ncbi:hypothetical protein AVEN_216718-1, partial [Araneus ventricosus]
WLTLNLQNALRNVLSYMQLGDKTVSVAARDASLSLGKIEESDMRMLWFQRLPITTQQILSASTDKRANFKSLALTADKSTIGRNFESDLFHSLPNTSISKIRTAAYNPSASNGMVERFHRQLKAFDVPLRFNKTLGTTITNDIARDLRPVAASSHSSAQIFVYKELVNCSHVFVRRDAVRCPVQQPYDGPFQVLQRKAQDYKIQVMEIQMGLSLNRLKPVFGLKEPGASVSTCKSSISQRMNLVHPVQRVHVLRQVVLRTP